MNKLFFIFLFLILNSGKVLAQNDSTQLFKQLDFLFYLLEHKQFDDVNYYGEQLLNDTISTGLRDSVAFIMGGVNEQFKDFKKARKYYDDVSETSAYIFKARFTSAVLDVEDKNYASALDKVMTFSSIEDNIIEDLTTFESAGIFLLEKDYHAYDSLTENFNPSAGIIASEYQQLKNSNDQLRNTKRKSPFVAGALSAIVPGLGKVYSGLNGQAVASFLRVVPLGIISVENYVKHGSGDAQFIIFTSLFSLFYIGNIWGSALSVQIANNKRINEIDYNISVGLRIPVDKLFQ